MATPATTTARTRSITSDFRQAPRRLPPSGTGAWTNCRDNAQFSFVPEGRDAQGLHVVTHLDLGGAERVALDIARGLNDRIEFAVFCVRGVARSPYGAALREECAANGIKIFEGTPLPLKSGGIFRAAIRLAGAIRSFAPDNVHLHTEIPNSVVSGCPMTCTVNLRSWASDH